MVLEIGRWKVQKKNAKEHLETLQQSIDFQKKNLDRFFYEKSQFIKLQSKDESKELWMFIDEYSSQESYNEYLEEAPIIEIEMAEILEKWGNLIDVESFKTEVFILQSDLCIKK